MKPQEAIQLFENKKVRTVWDSDQEKWYFSIVDVIAILTDSPNPQVYWRVMKKRLKDKSKKLLGIGYIGHPHLAVSSLQFQTVTICNGFIPLIF